MHKNSLSEPGSKVRCQQFIERAGTDGHSREIEADRFEDDPRRLGKGRVRLVGLAPLKLNRKVQQRRQDSPVPLAAFARRQQREEGTWRPGAIRSRSKSSQVAQAGFGSE